MRREYYWMISKYVKEQKRYTQDELRKIFECTADETVQIIRKLKEYGIVKNVKKSDRQSMLSDLVEEDIRLTDIESGERELYYVFSFVGVIVVYGGRVFDIYENVSLIVLSHSISPVPLVSTISTSLAYIPLS